MATEDEFTLVLTGVKGVGREVMAPLFEAGCDDATVSLRGGVVRLAFDRRADSREEAIASAIRDVGKAGFEATLEAQRGSRPGH